MGASAKLRADPRSPLDTNPFSMGIRAFALVSLLLAFVTCAAEPLKVLRFASPSAETKYDPGAESDQVAGYITDSIFESLLQYDYLARPVKLIPNTATALPEVLDGGATYVFHIKRGIYFTPDQAFKDKPRELVAADYAYSVKRLLDPQVRSQWNFLFAGKLVGGDQLVERAKQTGKFDYDAPIEGLTVPDRYTLRIRLKAPDFNLPYIMAMPATSAMAREVVEHYGEDIGAHPVGTGPFLLKEWRRSSRTVLEKNPQYRGESIDTSTASADPLDQAIVRDIGGKRLPLVDRVEMYIVEEEQTRWLAFLNNEHDFLVQIPKEYNFFALPGGKLAPNLAKMGIRAVPEEEAHTTYTFFNMDDPVVGGYTAEKVALRRAIGLAYDKGAELVQIRKNQARVAQSPIPPGMAGYDAKFVNPLDEYNPPKAKALLDMFGYVDRDGDGYRELPDGRPLTIEYASPPTFYYRQFDELWLKCMKAVGIRLGFRKAPLPELRDAARLGKIQMMTYGWVADYPDGENFLQLFTTKALGGANYSHFHMPQYDRLYETAAHMPDSPERTALYYDMSKLVLVYAPWLIGFNPVQQHLLHSWVKGYKKHPMTHATWKYLDVDTELRHAVAGQ
jgi:ABC-type transport system substrate-binding protein